MIRTPATIAEDADSSVLRLQLERLFGTRATTIVNVVNATISVMVLWGVVPTASLLGWYVTMAVLITARLSLARVFATHPGALTTRRWAQLHTLGSGLTGLVWGVTGSVLLTVDDPVAHMLVGLTAAGMGAGALAASFAHLPSFLAFLHCHVVPVALCFALHGGAVYYGMAAMGLAFVAMLGSVGRDFNRAYRSTLALQSRLRDSESRFRDFASAASHWSWEVDGQLRFTFVSDGFERYTGIPAASVLGKRGSEISADVAERRVATSEIEATMRAHRSFMDIIVPYPIGDGKILHLAVSAKPVLGNAKEFLGYRGVTRDITAQRVAESEAGMMRSARDFAAAADVAKTQFLANMSHELRTPLNAIIGFSEMMNMEIFGPFGAAAYKGYVGHIQDSGRHLLDLVDQLLDMSRIELGQYRLNEEEQSLRALIDICVAMVGATIQGSDIRVVAAAVDPEWIVRVDGRALRQVLINLLSNAVKFTPAGGRVDVSAARGAGGEVVIDVVDTGRGIPAAELAMVFQAFRSTADGRARRGGGAGLGLWISRSLMELHDGTLVLDSVEGQGTRATVTIPASRVREARAAAARTPTRDAAPP